jgi:hypothetical protein
MKFSFTGTIATYINSDWAYVERLIDFSFVDSPEAHRAEGSAIAFVESAAKRGGLNKISVLLLERAAQVLIIAAFLHFSSYDGQCVRV